MGKTKSGKKRDLPKEILKVLLTKSIKQKELAEELKINRSLLKYHLDHLEAENLVMKDKIMEVGTVKIYEVSINTLAFHRIRKILGLKVEGTALITGFGKLNTGYKIPDSSKALLLEERPDLKIDKIICFTTEESVKKRQEKEHEENLIPMKELELHSHIYEDYRRFNTRAFDDLDRILLENIKKYIVFLDLTPLSKLLSFRLLQYSDKYNIPSFYIGKDSENNDILIWFRS